MRIEIEKQTFTYLETVLRPLQRIAAKLGLTPITTEIVGEPRVETKSFIPREYRDRMDSFTYARQRVYTWLSVEINGEVPVLKGWKFLARVEHRREDGANLVHSHPSAGEEVPEIYRDRRECDHCGHNRYRKDTFIVKHVETGAYKQVGRTCLKDFMGHKNPEALAKYFAGIAEIEDYLKAFTSQASDDDFSEVGHGFRYVPQFQIEEILAFTSAWIRLDGYTSKTQAREREMVSTAECVVEHYGEPMRIEKAFGMDVFKVEYRDYQLAASTLKWLYEKKTTESHLNDYFYNLYTMAESGEVEYKDFGYIVSLIPSYQRDVAKATEKTRKEHKGEAKDEHFGEIKKREMFNFVCRNKFYTEGYYGVTVIHSFVDEEGREAVWFASKESDIEIGESYKVKATVKEHGEYHGKAQTVVTRVAVV